MKIFIEFETDNAAFIDNPREIEDVLIAAGMKVHACIREAIEDDEASCKLRDSNGNVIGHVKAEAAYAEKGD